MARIAIARTTAELERCFPVMAQLRPHLKLHQFTRCVRRQQKQGYQLVFLEEGSDIQSVAGFRILEFLVYGKFLYVDDLVTREAVRSKNHGGKLFDWLVALARKQQCVEFHLDSGVQRFGAHRFYLRKGMDITAHHFGMKLS